MHLKTTLMAMACLLSLSLTHGQSTIFGELKKWHTVRIQFQGPSTSESAVVNPFLDYRLNVIFTAPDGRQINVPGFYAADGNAAQTSATNGSIWEVRFSPDQIGSWSYTASFRTGTNIAVELEATAGSVTAFDGANGSFSIGPSDKSLPDNRAKGRLSYVGERYLKFEENDNYFLKAGADSPENLLAYTDFDNTVGSKTWGPHEQDWSTGDPTWGGGKGKGILGAVNYLSQQGMNSFSFLTMNVIGDGKDVWPWVSSEHSGLDGTGGQDAENRMRYDVSKLEQWEILFTHADSKGMYLHFKTQETENDQLLDGGELGISRKLYYRELIARFGHHLALNWNLGEENDIFSELSDPNNTTVKAYASYIRSLDPYDHHIVIHTFPSQKQEVYTPLLGFEDITGPSIQSDIQNVHKDIKYWIEQADASGKAWVVANDEQGGPQVGVAADASYTGDTGEYADNRDDVRHQILWGTLMAGGAGVEYYFGYQTGETDLSAEDWRSRATKWGDARIALDFFNDHLPFWDMSSNDALTSKSDNYCFAKPGDIYAIYLNDGGTDQLNLEGQNGVFEIFWYDPANGGSLQSGTVSTINGGGTSSLGNAPVNQNSDWVVLVRRASDSGGDPDPGGEACQGTYQEQNGQVIIETENLNASSGWELRNTANGFTGNGYLEWLGGDNFSAPGNGMITVPIQINTPGRYRFQWRSKVGQGTNSTEHNDSWLRFPDAADFYGEKSGNRIYPKGSGKSPNPQGSGAEGWFKVYLSGSIEWTWATYTSDNDAHNIYVEFDSPGIYTLEISGRSNNHLIDRITLSLNDSGATDLALSETPCNEDPNEPVAVTGISINPKEASLSIGQSLTLVAEIQPANASNKNVTWSSSDPSIVSVNTAGEILALAPGQVTITVVTEDGGFSASATVDVNVGDDPNDPGDDPNDPGDDPNDPGDDPNDPGDDPNDPGDDPSDPEPQPILSSTSASGVEGSTLTFEFKLNKTLSERVEIPIIFNDISARANDYGPLQEVLIFEAGTNLTNLEVPTVSDNRIENNESFEIRAGDDTDGIGIELPEVLAIGTIIDDDQSMKVSPNPAAPFSQVAIAYVQAGTYQVEIYTTSGNLQQRLTVEVLEGEETTFKLGDLARGLYIVNLTGSDYAYTAKLMVR